MSTCIDFRYLVFSNGRYIDLYNGRFYNNNGEKIIAQNKKNGAKLTPKELKLLKLIIKNKNSFISSGILGDVLDSGDGKEENNVYKRILSIKNQVAIYCDAYQSVDTIIQVDKHASDTNLRYYGFFINEHVVLSSEPLFAKVENEPDNIEKLLERKRIDSIADEASSDSRLGRYQDALYKRNMVYKWRKENLGEEHDETVRAMANLATSYNKLKMYDEALALRQRVLAIRKKTCEPYSDLLRIAKKNLAITLNLIGGKENLLEAERLRKEIDEMLSI